MYVRILKRILDIFLAFIGLLFAALPMAIIGIIVRLDSKGPVIFRQKRMGRNKRIFTMYKFRSMVVNDFSDCVMASDENDRRITKFGAFIRKTSLDELPQFINILKGDMSFIGPRPMLPAEYELYKESIPGIEQRFDIRPGLFCTVDVEYRAEASPELQMKYDSDYIGTCSFPVDCKCLIGVFKTVLSQKHVYAVEQKKETEEKRELASVHHNTEDHQP